MTSCPNCGKPVDPIRSRFVGVKGGKVVAYCSAECLSAQETKPTAVPKRAMVGYDSAPVIEIIHEPASGVVTSAPDRRDASAPRVSASASASTSGAVGKKRRKSQPIEPVLDEAAPSRRASSEPADEWAKNAELIKADAGAPSVKPRRGLMMALIVAAIAAAGAFVAYKYIFVKKATSATVAPVAKVDPAPPAAPVQPPAPPQPPAITIPEALDLAKVAIAKNLRADSPRIQRLAAAALERSGDRASSELLVAALKNETSDLAKVELAYALARGGDARGVTALVQGLASPAPDPKRWAAERLVRLAIGETEHKPETLKAIEVLVPALDQPANRLVAAELLAQLVPADARALKVLDAIRADAAAAPEIKARATVALGLAGRADVAPALHDLLTAGSERPAAAAALAHLHDATAKPVLVEQLGVMNQRVRAARGLRALDPSLDPIPLLAPLLATIATAKDADQVDAGEALLVLCGPAAWSARE